MTTRKKVFFTLEYSIKPGLEYECEGCEFCKVTKESFDHAFGTEYQETVECTASDAQLACECPAIDEYAANGYQGADTLEVEVR